MLFHLDFGAFNKCYILEQIAIKSNLSDYYEKTERSNLLEFKLFHIYFYIFLLTVTFILIFYL